MCLNKSQSLSVCLEVPELRWLLLEGFPFFLNSVMVLDLENPSSSDLGFFPGIPYHFRAGKNSPIPGFLEKSINSIH